MKVIWGQSKHSQHLILYQSLYQMNKMCLWNTNAPATAIFWKLWPWYSTLTLTDDPDDLGNNKKALPQGILMWNMKPNSYQSEDMANVKDFADKQTDRPTNGRVKTICIRIYRCET